MYYHRTTGEWRTVELLGWIALGVVSWCLVGLGVALLVGRIIANRDRNG